MMITDLVGVPGTTPTGLKGGAVVHVGGATGLPLPPLDADGTYLSYHMSCRIPIYFSFDKDIAIEK